MADVLPLVNQDLPGFFIFLLKQVVFDCVVILIRAPDVRLCLRIISDDRGQVADTVVKGNNLRILAQCVYDKFNLLIQEETELVEVDGRRLLFNANVYDEVGKIGEGTHERFIVDCEEFQKKTDEKLKK